MSAAAIFLLIIGLPVAGAGLFWLAAKVGWMRDDLPPGEKDVLQRYGPPLLLIVIGALLFAYGGLPGLMAGAAVVLILSFVAAVLATLIEGKGRSSDQPLPPSYRRFLRHFRQGVTEFPFHLNPFI